MSKFSTGETMVLSIGVLLGIDLMFAPWHTFGSLSASGVESPNSSWGIAALVVTVGMVLLIVLTRPVLAGQATFAWAVFLAGIAVLALLAAKLMTETSYLGPGAVLGMLFGAALAWGGFLVKGEASVSNQRGVQTLSGTASTLPLQPDVSTEGPRSPSPDAAPPSLIRDPQVRQNRKRGAYTSMKWGGGLILVGVVVYAIVLSQASEVDAYSETDVLDLVAQIALGIMGIGLLLLMGGLIARATVSGSHSSPMAQPAMGAYCTSCGGTLAPQVAFCGACGQCTGQGGGGH